MKSITNSDTAISTVVSAVLILGLIVTVATIINVSYIPEWKTDAEYSHMTDVLDDVSDLKSNIDLLSAVDSQTTISVPVKMGGGEIPIVAPGKSSGTLAVNDYNFDLTVKANNSSEEVYNSNNGLTNLGSISYRSNNNYYVDKVFEYENGGLIIAQGDRSIMKLSPKINIQKNGSNISLFINAINININGDTKTISSNNIENIQLRSNSSQMLNKSQNLKQVSIIVNSSYPDAWGQYFNTTAKSEGLTYIDDYKLKNPNTNTVNFTVTKNPINLKVTKDTFIARLTPLINLQ